MRKFLIALQVFVLSACTTKPLEGIEISKIREVGGTPATAEVAMAFTSDLWTEFIAVGATSTSSSDGIQFTFHIMEDKGDWVIVMRSPDEPHLDVSTRIRDKKYDDRMRIAAMNLVHDYMGYMNSPEAAK